MIEFKIDEIRNNMIIYSGILCNVSNSITSYKPLTDYHITQIISLIC